jgi:molybdopterin molybdotransferase
MKSADWTLISETIAKEFDPVEGGETLSLRAASGLVLAGALTAASPLPPHTHSVMDGYALGSSPPGLYHLRTGAVPELASNEASPVAAGSPVPEGSAGVVLADHTTLQGDTLSVTMILAKSNIRRAGEEARSGETLLTTGTRLDARHIALAAATGVHALHVQKRPRIALLCLHDGEYPFPHARITHALLDSPCVHLTDAGTVRHGLLANSLERLSDSHDLVVVVADSLGSENGILERSIKAAGGKTKIYRATLKPAKPVVLGRIGAAGILGLAGTAYATSVAAHLFLRPVLQRLLGLPLSHHLWPSSAGFEQDRDTLRTEAMPVCISVEHGKIITRPAGRFGQLRALTAMDGFALLPANGLPARMGSITIGVPIPFIKISFPLV